LKASSSFILQALHAIANPQKAQFLSRFFKTAKGQYAEGDLMLGIPVPAIRTIVNQSPPLPLEEIQTILNSQYHEARMAGLLLLVKQFKKAKEIERKEIFNFYLKNTRRVNNWDLVDTSCRDIIGLYLADKTDRSILYRLADSDNLWEQRIAIVSTWTFIKNRRYADTLAIAEKLLLHKHDLIHKAVGWMLREVGKKDRQTLENFLEIHSKHMPRTALRYALEHFPPADRAYFMKR
jgi:3-methyladenine DNA glycosylase AlkD